MELDKPYEPENEEILGWKQSVQKDLSRLQKDRKTIKRWKYAAKCPKLALEEAWC